MNKKIPILYLDNTFTFGGAINSLCYLLRALDKDKYTPILVTGQPVDFLKASFPGIQWIQYVPKLPWIDNRIYKKIAAFPLFKLRLLMQVLNLLRFVYWLIAVTIPEAYRYYRLGKKHHVALVHLNNILGSQLAGIIAAKLLGVPCVAHLRDFEEVHFITKFYARLIDHHVAISGAIKDNLLQIGVPEANISIIYDALDLNEFNPELNCDYLFKEFNLDPQKLRYGIFGRVVEWKGIREFIQAAQMVARQFPEAQALIVGGPSDGDEDFYSEMQELVRHLGLQDTVLFTGYRKDIPALMKCMDIVVHASNRAEPFGMVVIEGMAMGKPVVATRAGGPLDIVDDGTTGYLVEVGSSEELAAAIGKLLHQPYLQQQLGRKGRERVEMMFSNAVYAEKVQLLYENYLNGGNV